MILDGPAAAEGAGWRPVGYGAEFIGIEDGPDSGHECGSMLSIKD